VAVAINVKEEEEEEEEEERDDMVLIQDWRGMIEYGFNTICASK